MAQGFILKADSGYTEGPVQFGLSFIGMTGFQLDSSPDRTGTGLLSFTRAPVRSTTTIPRPVSRHASRSPTPNCKSAT